jgi:hypothetical protein
MPQVEQSHWPVSENGAEGEGKGGGVTAYDVREKEEVGYEDGWEVGDMSHARAVMTGEGSGPVPSWLSVVVVDFFVRFANLIGSAECSTTSSSFFFRFLSFVSSPSPLGWS